MASPTAAAACGDGAELLDALAETRRRTLELVAAVSAEDLERVHSPLMSPLVWDLGHIAAFEDLWLVHRVGGRALLRADLAQVYDAFETPRSHRGELPFLDAARVFDYAAEVRERTLEVISERGIDPTLHEMVLRHEQQHTETMLQTMELAGIDPFPGRPGNRGAAAAAPASPPPAAADSGLELVAVAAGDCTIGSAPPGFAYDNERPRHRTDVRGYLIGRTAITNATYLTFVEGGGYERREWWSQEGWAWKEEYDITRPGGWTPDLEQETRLGRLEPLKPDRPVVHLSWFEADAFARAHDARLPSELEWEKAATWDHERHAARAHPWGEDAVVPGHHANLDQLSGGTASVGAFPDGASPCGCLGMLGDVWEWTSSEFSAYPEFVAHPYRDYSEVFFGRGYRVLRGASWATRARCARATFRNWDLPQRRQIFAGMRIARDA